MSRRVCKPCWATNCHQCVDPDSCPCNHWPLDSQGADWAFDCREGVE